MSEVTVQPGESIQMAVDAASPGDTILVKPGMYQPFTVTKDNLLIRSTVKWGAVIDGGDSRANGVTAGSGADGWTLDGFEIRNLRSQGGSSSGVELYSGGANATIRNCHIHHIGQGGYTGSNGQVGVYVERSGVTIEHNYVHDIGRNQADHRDHGVYANGPLSSLTIRGNYFATIRKGWAIQLYPDAVTDAVVEDNTFVDGQADDGSFIILGANLTGLRVVGNTFWQDGSSYPLNLYKGSYSGCKVSGNVTTGSRMTSSSAPPAGLGVGANTVNAKIPMPPPPTGGDPPPPPPPPEMEAPVLQVGAVTNTAVTLKWAALPSVVSYRFLKDGVQVSTGGATKTSVKFGSLPPAPIVLTVVAVYPAGETQASRRTLRVVEGA